MRGLDRRTVIGVVALWAAGAAVIAILLGVSGGASNAADPLTVHGNGISDTHDGYRIVGVSLPERRGDDVDLEFQIVNKAGEPLLEYAPYEGRLMHLQIIRDDTSAFQHVDATLDGDVWRAQVAVPDGGQYHVYAEFVPQRLGKKTHPIVLGTTFIIGGDTTFVPPPEPVASVESGGLVVSRPDGAERPPVDTPVTLRFEVQDSEGRPVELDSYLGGPAFVTAYNQISLETIPLRTMVDDVGPGEIAVRAYFETRGEHRVFVEFQAEGSVHVAAFTIFAT